MYKIQTLLVARKTWWSVFSVKAVLHHLGFLLTLFHSISKSCRFTVYCCYAMFWNFILKFWSASSCTLLCLHPPSEREQNQKAIGSCGLESLRDWAAFIDIKSSLSLSSVFERQSNGNEFKFRHDEDEGEGKKRMDPFLVFPKRGVE